MTNEPATVRGTTARFHAKREAVIAAASDLFNERGIAGSSLSDVAARVGLVKNSVTYYYRRKEDLAVACLQRSIAVADGLLEQAAAPATLTERLTLLLHLHAQLRMRIARGEHPPVMLFHDIRALPPVQANEVFDAYNGMFRRLRALLRTAQTRHWDRVARNARAHLILSLVNSMGRLVSKYEPEDLVRVVPRLADLVLHGVSAPSESFAPVGMEQGWQLGTPGDSAADPFLHAAIELINEQGYRGASVVKIAERLNRSKGAFYYYNEKKDDLVEQCFVHSFGIMRRAMDLAEEGGGSGWSQLSAMARGLASFQVSTAGPLLRSTAHSALVDPEQRQRITLTTQRLGQRIASLCVTGLIDGSMRPLDPTLAAHHVLNGIDVAATLNRWAHSVTPQSVSEVYVKPLLRGMLAC